MKSYWLFIITLPIYKNNDSEDTGLAKYKEKLILMSIDRKKYCIQVWVINNYNIKQLNNKHLINMKV